MGGALGLAVSVSSHVRNSARRARADFPPLSQGTLVNNELRSSMTRVNLPTAVVDSILDDPVSIYHSTTLSAEARAIAIAGELAPPPTSPRLYADPPYST